MAVIEHCLAHIRVNGSGSLPAPPEGEIAQVAQQAGRREAPYLIGRQNQEVGVVESGILRGQRIRINIVDRGGGGNKTDAVARLYGRITV